ncbi:hypothetical protein [Thermobifida cellulosilytica]|mgnify:CR=1 FL=1|uniref:hypothetical protein n=1 Tax=Thermobifida cellulosilytica TaxID=144786 RepID=UPI000B0ED26D|nr:hypothetical protein [Thermobifida cellulosilytica]
MFRSEHHTARSTTARVAAALLCPVLFLASGTSALAEQPPRSGGTLRVDREVDVSGLYDFSVSDIAPGYRESWLVNVVNERPEPVTLGLRVDSLHNSDNGCNGSESRVDDTCEGEGELGDHLELRLGIPGNTRLFSSPLNEAVSGSGQIITVPARGEAEVVVGLSLPFGTGNEVQTDSVDFVLVWRAEAITGTAPVVLEDGVELRSTAVGSGPSADLALTGARIMLLVGLAVALVASGGLVFFLATGRGSTQQPSADQTADC